MPAKRKIKTTTIKTAKPKPAPKPPVVADEAMDAMDAAALLAKRWNRPGEEAVVIALRAVLLELRALHADIKKP